MSDTTLNVRLIPARKNEANWRATTTIPKKDEILYTESGPHNGYYKIGDGQNRWEDLEYIKPSYTYPEIQPISSITYNNFNSVGNSDPNGYYYFLKVQPDNYHQFWSIQYKITATIAGLTNYSGFEESYVTFYGRDSSILAYTVYNMIENTSYYPYYQHIIYRAKEAGITGEYGHAIGLRFYSSYAPTNTTYARTITCEVLKIEGCTYSFLDTPVLYADWPGNGSTNYDGRSGYDATSQGLTTTGDRNNYDRLLLPSAVFKAGSNGIKLYSLIMKDEDGTYQSLTTTSGTATTKTKNTVGFYPQNIWYYGGSGNIAAGSNTAAGYLYYSYPIDYRYSFNKASAEFTLHEPLYLVGTMDSNGLFYLDDEWGVQDLPSSEDGKIYIFIGYVYGNSGFHLSPIHPMFWYKDGKIREYILPEATQTVSGLMSAEDKIKLDTMHIASTVIPADKGRQVGWYRIAKLSRGDDIAYTSTIMALVGSWSTGSPTNGIFSIVTHNTYATITQLNACLGSIFTKIRLVKDTTNGIFYIDAYQAYPYQDTQKMGVHKFSFYGSPNAVPEVYSPTEPLTGDDADATPVATLDIKNNGMVANNFYGALKGNADTATTATTANRVAGANGTADANRHVWFSDSSTETARNYDDDFKYNPSTNTLSVLKIDSPELTGTPTAPTATSGTNTTQIATTAFVQNAVGNAEIGGRNLLKDSHKYVSNSNYDTADYYFGDRPPLHNEEVTIQIKGELAETKSYWNLYNSGGSINCFYVEKTSYDATTGIYTATGTWKVNTASNTFLRIYAFTSTQSGTSTIEWVKLERGNKPTDWTPAPEDLVSSLSVSGQTISYNNYAGEPIDSITTQDTQVTQTLSTADNNYPLLFGKNDITDVSNYTDTVLRNNDIYANLNNGELNLPSVYAKNYYRTDYAAYDVCQGITSTTIDECILYTGIKYVSSKLMPVIHITGHAYGIAASVDLKISFYIYNDTFVSNGVVDSGGFHPSVYLFKYTSNEEDYVALALKPSASLYFPSFNVNIFNRAMTGLNNIDLSMFRWEFVVKNGESLIPEESSTCVLVPYKVNYNPKPQLTIQGNGTNIGTYNGTNTATVNITKSSIGLANVDNKSSETIRGEITSNNVTTALGYTPAELDSNNKIISSQLPSYVDDVIEAYYYESNMYSSTTYTDANKLTGESDKIYVDLNTNKTYRWSGTIYVEISQSLALGETSSTAYRGDRGKIAYDHSQTTTGNPHNVNKNDVGLGNVENKSSETIRSEITDENITDALGYTPVPETRQINGKDLSDNINLTVDDIKPIMSRTYSGLIGSANDAPNASFYFMSVKPETYYTLWKIKYKVNCYIPNQDYYHSLSTVEIYGYQSTYVAYKIFNAHDYEGGNIRRCYYYHNYYRATSAGALTYGHLIGLGLRASNYPTNTSYPRTFTIDVLETKNCEVSLFADAIKYADAPGTGSTNYSALTEFDGYTAGLRETSDDNTITQLRVDTSTWKAGTNGLMGYGLFMEDGNGTYQSFTTVNGTATNKPKNPVGFRLPNIWYANFSGKYSAGASTGTSIAFISINFSASYSINASAITAHAPFYIVGTLGTDGLFYLSDTWWSQELPTEEDGKLYVYVGRAYSTTSVHLQPYHPIFEFKDGKVQQFFLPEATQNNHGIMSATDKVKIDTLGKTLSVNGKSYTGLADVDVGTIGVNYGGTGTTTFTSGQALIGNGANAISTRAITNNTSATAVTASTNLITANTLYYHKGNSNIVNVGTISSGTWQGTVVGVSYGGTGKSNGKDAANFFLNSLDTGSSTPVDADYYISQYVGGGTTTTTYHRRPMSALWSYVSGKGDSRYLKLSGGTLTGNLSINGGSYFGFYSADTKGTAPTTQTWREFRWLEKDAAEVTTAHRFAGISQSVNTSNTNTFQFSVYRPVANSTNTGYICLYYPETGTPYMQTNCNIKIALSGTKMTANTTQNVLSYDYQNPNGKTKTVNVIRTYGDNENDANNGIAIIGSSSGTTVVSSGESAPTVINNKDISNNENTYIISDSSIYLWTNAQTPANVVEAINIDTNGNAFVAGNIILGLSTDTVERSIKVMNSAAVVRLAAATSGNHGLYSNTHSNWMIYSSNTATSVITPRDFIAYGYVYSGSGASTDESARGFVARNKLSQIRMLANTDGVHGLYSTTNSKWMIYMASDNANFVRSNVSIVSGSALGNNGKTGWNDGKAGFWATSDGNIRVTHATAGSSIGFHYAGSTSTTATISEVSQGLLATSSAFSTHAKTAGNDGTGGVYLSTVGSIELSGSTPYIDFHYDNSTEDYTTRIIENESGVLQLIGRLKATRTMTSWINTLKYPFVNISANGSSGAIGLATLKTKDGYVGLGSYPSLNNYLYLTYATDANYNEGTNTISQIKFDASTGEITATTFVGALTGHASSDLALTGGTVSGTLILSRNQDASTTANNKPALIVGGTDTQAHIEIDSDEIIAKTNGTSTADLWLSGTTVYINSKVALHEDNLSTYGVTGVKGNSESTYRKGNVNITCGNIGALALSGGTLTGNLVISADDTTERYLRVKNSLGNIVLDVSSTGKHGLYSTTKEGWVLYCTADANTTDGTLYIPRALDVSGVIHSHASKYIYTAITKGTAPSAQSWREIIWLEKDAASTSAAHRLAYISQSVTTANLANMTIGLYNPAADSTSAASLALNYPKDGTPYATWPSNFRITTTNRGYYLTCTGNILYGALFDNGDNLWIGASTGTSVHHRGANGKTYISAGYSNTNSEGNNTVYIAVPSLSGTTWSSSYYSILHSGNYSDYVLGKSGGTVTGNVTIQKNALQWLAFVVQNSDARIQMQCGSDGYPALYAAETADQSAVVNLIKLSYISSVQNSVFVQVGNSSKDTRLYGANVYLQGTSTAVVSDVRLKRDLTLFDNRYETFFMNLIPTQFKMINGGSHRLHSGFIAQEVEDALSLANISTKDFAGLIIDGADNVGYYEELGYDPFNGDNKQYYLRYEEFISLNTWMIQKNYNKLIQHEDRITILERENKELKDKITMLENQLVERGE